MYAMWRVKAALLELKQALTTWTKQWVIGMFERLIEILKKTFCHIATLVRMLQMFSLQITVGLREKVCPSVVYSPDLSPLAAGFFHSMQQDFKAYINFKIPRLFLEDFIKSKLKSLFYNKICNLSERCHEVIKK